MSDEAPAAPAAPAAMPAASLDAALPESGAADEARGWRRLFRVPLLQKLVVTDLIINILAFLVMRNARLQYASEIMVASLLVTLVLNSALVYWALVPLRALQVTADRVARGDLTARVPASRFADRQVARIGRTFNRVLDRLLADRARVRTLAAQVIRAGDEERAHIARDLHDSTAQQLSALEMLVAASVREVPAGSLHDRLGVMHDIVTESLREVRTLSHTVHPRVLDDLGLVAAIETLARRTRDQSGLAITVTSAVRAEIAPPAASVLYRVTQEALRNAIRHAGARAIAIHVAADARAVSLTIADDGRGFDVAAAEAARTGLGLFVMQERLALVDGALTIDSAPSAGTRITATIGVDPIVAE